MYQIWLMMEGTKMLAVRSDTNAPIMFDDIEDANEFIGLMMANEQRPQFMWVQKIGECKNANP